MIRSKESRINRNNRTSIMQDYRNDYNENKINGTNKPISKSKNSKKESTISTSKSKTKEIPTGTSLSIQTRLQPDHSCLRIVEARHPAEE